jgi:hypothetical protein
MNSLRWAVEFLDHPDLTIVPTFLMKDGVTIDVGENGRAMINISLVRTLDLALKFKKAYGAKLGKCAVFTDVDKLEPLFFTDCEMRGFAFQAGSAGFIVSIIGVYVPCP